MAVGDNLGREMAEAQQNPAGRRRRLIGGQYERIRTLSANEAPGNFSVRVILARGLEGREVVLKEMHPALTEDMIRQEAALHDRVSHPNIARYYGLVMHEQRIIVDDAPPETKTCWYLVTEYLRGGSLAQKIRRGPMAVHDARRLLLSIARGLAFIHSVNIQHRDLKPENICLEHDGDDAEPKILDFGGSKEGALSRMTTVGIGTPMYMSPERLKREKWGRGDDIWALGILYAEMLHGQRIPDIFGGEMMAGDRVEREIAWLVEQCGGDDLLRRMLARNPEHRPTTADIVTELEGRGGSPVPVPSVPGTAAPDRRFGTVDMATDRDHVAARQRDAGNEHDRGWTRLHTAMARGDEGDVRAALREGATDSATEDGVHASSLRPNLWRRATGREAAVDDSWTPPGSAAEALSQLVAMTARGSVSTELLCRRVCAGVETLGTAFLQEQDVAKRRIGGYGPFNWTLLTAAAGTGRHSLCRLCLDRGADVDKAKDNGATPLHVACGYKYRHVAALLLDRGADPTKKNNTRWTPEFYARSIGASDRELTQAMELATRDRAAAIERLWEMGEKGPPRP